MRRSGLAVLNTEILCRVPSTDCVPTLAERNPPRFTRGLNPCSCLGSSELRPRVDSAFRGTTGTVPRIFPDLGRWVLKTANRFST